jgi:hypothetical protein
MIDSIPLPRTHPPKAWQRRPEETGPAFEAFVLFRDMASPRSIKQVAEILGKGRSTLDEWAQKYRWNDRCRLWDNEVDKRTSNAQIAEIKAMKRRQAQMAFELQSAAHMALTALTAKLKTAKSTGKMLVSPEQLSRMMDIGARLERLNHDEPSSISRIQEQVDFSGLSVDELVTLKTLLEKSGTSA